MWSYCTHHVHANASQATPVHFLVSSCSSSHCSFWYTKFRSSSEKGWLIHAVVDYKSMLHGKRLLVISLWVSGVGFASKEFVHIASYRHWSAPQHDRRINITSSPKAWHLSWYTIKFLPTKINPRFTTVSKWNTGKKFQEYACTEYASYLSFPIIQVSCQQSHSQTFKVCMLSDSHQASGAQKHRTCILVYNHKDTSANR